MEIKIISKKEVRELISERERILWKELDRLRAEILSLNEKITCLNYKK